MTRKMRPAAVRCGAGARIKGSGHAQRCCARPLPMYLIGVPLVGWLEKAPKFTPLRSKGNRGAAFRRGLENDPAKAIDRSWWERFPDRDQEIAPPQGAIS